MVPLSQSHPPLTPAFIINLDAINTNFVQFSSLLVGQLPLVTVHFVLVVLHPVILLYMYLCKVGCLVFTLHTFAWSSLIQGSKGHTKGAVKSQLSLQVEIKHVGLFTHKSSVIFMGKHHSACPSMA